MANDFDRALNNAAYHKYRQHIDATFPKDWFVAIHEGQIVCDGKSFDDVLQSLRQKGINPRDAMVVQSGEPNMDHMMILGAALR